MYFPKSQIKTNLYANPGELVYLNNNLSFSGYYFETSEGRYYTGKSPKDGPNLELTFPQDLNNSLTQDKNNVYVNIQNSYVKTGKGNQIYKSLKDRKHV